MATITKRTNKSGTYYYLVESARIDGKPRIIKQIYLGTADRIAKAIEQLSSGTQVPDPQLVEVYDFGAVAALYSIADRLGVSQIIDEIAGKRNQGLPVSSSIILAAINRAVAPKSKNTFLRWFNKTVLYKMFPSANRKNLSSQGFWNNMSVLDEDKIRKIEDEITKQVVEQYKVDTGCLLFDNTNFFTYIDTANASALAKRGNSKEKRTDIKIVGLSLMVSADHNIPLYHETYPGNTNDAKQFSGVIGRLKERYGKLGMGECGVTLVFDKGNNNEDNIGELIGNEPRPFHFVGGLRLNQCNELLDIPKASYTALDGEFNGMIAYRTKKCVYDRQFTVVLTHNPILFKEQMEGILNNISACEKEFAALSQRLLRWKDGTVKKGKKPTVDSVAKNIRSILSAEHMNEVFDYSVSCEPEQFPEIAFSLNEENLHALQERKLGKSVVFTDHCDWSNEQIVTAYHSQYHVEDAFKHLKDTTYLSFRPIRHFTDAHIRVHAFYCVLAFTLTCLLQKELEELGHKVSIRQALECLSEAQQVRSVYDSGNKSMVTKTAYSRLIGMAKDYADKYGLLNYLS